jgi:hypothetical protein
MMYFLILRFFWFASPIWFQTKWRVEFCIVHYSETKWRNIRAPIIRISGRYFTRFANLLNHSILWIERWIPAWASLWKTNSITGTSTNKLTRASIGTATLNTEWVWLDSGSTIRLQPKRSFSNRLLTNVPRGTSVSSLPVKNYLWDSASIPKYVSPRLTLPCRPLTDPCKRTLQNFQAYTLIRLLPYVTGGIFATY